MNPEEKKKERRRIDWRAVQWVIEGARMELSLEEKRAVIRRIGDRLMNSGDSPWETAVGKVNVDDLAHRMNTTPRSVARMKASLPKAHKRRCPVCRQFMWVHDADGTVELHPRPTGDQCYYRGPGLVIAS
jgi:uncharacterized protein YlxP (DUF503 family)